MGEFLGSVRIPVRGVVSAIGKSGASSYTLTDLWTGAVRTTSSAISASAPGHGVVMYRVH